MSTVGRATRGRVAAAVLAALTVLSLLAALLCHRAQVANLNDQVAAAEQRAHLVADTVLYNALTSGSVQQPMDGALYRDLLVDLQANVFSDPRVARVRIWSPAGVLIFSTDARYQIGQRSVSSDTAITGAVSGQTSSRLTESPFTFATTGGTGSTTELLQTFVPLTVPDRNEPQGAVEVDQLYGKIVAAAGNLWERLQWVFVALALVFGASTALLLWNRAKGTAAPPAPEEPIGEAAPEDLVERTRAAEERSRTLHAELEELKDRMKHAREEFRAVEEELAWARAALAERGEADAADPELLERLDAAEHRVTDLESRAQLAETRARASERRADASESRTRELEDDLLAAVERANAAEERAHSAEARAIAAIGTQPAERAVTRPARPDGDLDELERRVRDAESRAAQAQQMLREMAAPEVSAQDEDEDANQSLSPEAEALRARLARTAARKKALADDE